MAPLQGLSGRIKTARTAFRRPNKLKPSASTPLLSISQPINNGPVALPSELQAIRDQYVNPAPSQETPKRTKRRSSDSALLKRFSTQTYETDKGTDISTGDIQNGKILVDKAIFEMMPTKASPRISAADPSPELRVPKRQPGKSSTFGPNASPSEVFEARGLAKSHTLPTTSNFTLQKLVSTTGLDRFLKPKIKISRPFNNNRTPATAEQLEMVKIIDAEKRAAQEKYSQDLSAFLRGQQDTIPVFPSGSKLQANLNTDKRSSLGSIASRRSVTLSPIVTSAPDQQKLLEQRRSSAEKPVSPFKTPSSSTTLPELSAGQTPTSSHPVTPKAALQFHALAELPAMSKRQGFIWPFTANDNFI